MGPAILVTLGILLLLRQFWYVREGEIFPILLIVIGLLLIAAHNASAEGHTQPWWARGGSLESEETNPSEARKEPQVKL
jgi:hypothetical protein